MTDQHGVTEDDVETALVAVGPMGMVRSTVLDHIVRRTLEAVYPRWRERWKAERRDWDQDRADWKGRAVQAEAMLDAARKLHQPRQERPSGLMSCGSCHNWPVWPCPTAAALGDGGW